jgi:hypothetical protein
MRKEAIMIQSERVLRPCRDKPTVKTISPGGLEYIGEDPQ